VSVYEIDCTTGEEEHRPLTEDEQAALEQGRQEHAAQAKADQWGEVLRIRGAQLSQSDWLASAPVDVPDAIRDAAKQYEADWLAFRQGLRDLPETFGYPDGDPTAVVWPTIPPAPKLVGTPPPSFVEFSPQVNFLAWF
jgi:hypothetical protein